MNDWSKPALTRLARKAGIKSLSEDCFDFISLQLEQRLTKILKTALILQKMRQSKILTSNDIYDSLELQGKRITRSENLGTTTVGK